MGYIGCVMIEEMCIKFQFVWVIGVGMKESYVYDVMIIKEVFNYWVG